MNSSSIFLILLAGLLGLLLVVNLVLAITVILKMRGRGEAATMKYSWNRPFIRGWKHPDLRALMVGWTLALILVSVVFCVLMVAILTM
ncbi:MAG: hypothetical protein JXJ17_18560 [Anaerolineae bacterium]|nr:hypothetical protein [Anaerolineae bacterium]